MHPTLNRAARRALARSARKPRPAAKWRPMFTHVDVLMASTTDPLPLSWRQTQLTAMHMGLAAMARGADPTGKDWMDVTDTVNLLNTLRQQGLAHDPHGVIDAASDALAAAARRHLEHGQTMRLTGAGIQACRDAIAVWADCLEQLPARTVIETYARTERRIHQIVTNPATPEGVTIIK